MSRRTAVTNIIEPSGRTVNAKASIAARLSPVFNYVVIPGLFSLLFLPRSVAVTLMLILSPAVWLRAKSMGISVNEGRVSVRNFWRHYDLPRADIESVERDASPITLDTFPVPFPVYLLRLKDGRRVYVIASTGGYKKVMTILRSLGIPFAA